VDGVYRGKKHVITARPAEQIEFMTFRARLESRKSNHTTISWRILRARVLVPLVISNILIMGPRFRNWS
jgi:hypothetical protein